MTDKKLTLVQHLEELRIRLIKSIVVIVVSSLFIYSRVEDILLFLAKPVGKLVFISPQEAFIVNLKLALWVGLFFASPFVIYQIWQFIFIGLRDRERKNAFVFGCFSFILFVLGCLFGCFALVPIGIKFLMGCAPGFITPMISVDNYISFLGALSFVFGLVFQLPLIIMFLVRMGLVSPNLLTRRWREAVVIIFIVAAILTPPDVFSQLLMAGPLVILYVLGVILSRLVKPRKKIVPLN
jgi:sec-independent protein translocase protein TatC